MDPAINPLRTLLIDNYDSYTYNLYQGIAEVYGAPPKVIRNDEVEWPELRRDLERGLYQAVVLSPGPGTPARPSDIGVSMHLLRERTPIPVLGVCLGMQALALAFGAEVRHAACGPMHGRLSGVRHSGHALFHGIPSGPKWQVVRYHSLEVPQASLPACLHATAWALAPPDEAVMAISHATLPYHGVQFHPESVATRWGPALLRNFLTLAHEFHGAPAHTLPEGLLPQGPPGTAPIPRPYPCTDDSCGPVLGTPLSATIDLGLVHARLGKGALPSSLGAAPRVFERLFRPAPHAWWLDSAVTDRGGRWSFMGSGKGGALWRTASYLGDGVLEEGLSGEGGASASTTTHRLPGGFWDWLDEDVQARRLCPAAATAAADLPFDFWGGWVGYIGYELGTELGPGAGLAADVAGNPPHASLVWADRLLALDCATGEAYALACHIQGDGRAADEAQAWVAGMLEAVQAVAGEPDGETTPGAGAAGAPQDPAPSPDPVLDFQPRERHERYLDNIRACLQAMHDGESYELCLTTQLTRQGAPPAWPLYRTLRALNPAPYAAWLDFGAHGGPQICCSSPERFLRGDRGGVLEAKPIKGTAPRHPKDPVADAASAAELEASDKERAENLMIVDLLRNDLGRVCVPGSVQVPSLMALESFATVHQLVSTVTGLRRETASVVDCLRASFPGGSMTGAPKLRSMDILGRLEAGPRGVYSGSIGYISTNGAFDLNIVIRTAVVWGDRISIGAGGAITVQSGPEAEWEEMLLKARVLRRSVASVDALGVVAA
ncbi:ADC1 [Auxenochlorella protothecoides x Auxenochlorella symbiontica]